MRLEALSQDTGLSVLVSSPDWFGTDFSVKEKDEARLPICFWRYSLNAFIPRLPGV